MNAHRYEKVTRNTKVPSVVDRTKRSYQVEPQEGRTRKWFEKLIPSIGRTALSLVGEPIMYPRIDELLGELHPSPLRSMYIGEDRYKCI